MTNVAIALARMPTAATVVMAVLYMLLIAVFPTHAASPLCSSPRLRKEIRDLNNTEFAAFTRGMNQLKSSGRLNQYVAIHQQWTQPAHGGALFFAWHRRFIYQLETELLAITGPALSGLPYFDPFMSYSIFNPTHPRFLGDAQGCVTSGPFAGWWSTDGRCLTHELNQQPNFVDPRAMAQLIMSGSSFATFSNAYEFGQHATVHNGVGGQMVALAYSTNDYMFYLHHAHVDQVWYARQFADTSRFYWDYLGTHTPGGVGTVNLNTRIPPWQDTVGTVADVYFTMCYDYQPARRAALLSPNAQAAAPAPAAPNANAPVAAPTDGGPQLRRREASDNDAFKLFNFTMSDPLHRCTPLPANVLVRLGLDPAGARQACNDVNSVIEKMQAQEHNDMAAHAMWMTVQDVPKDDKEPARIDWVRSLDSTSVSGAVRTGVGGVGGWLLGSTLVAWFA
ncbi:hypothetical protein BCR44DRAFT_1252129 [Catenaria anguillulae PL171]|uniref:Tyrosinase copper-binding domain-containing protein n=1 Tax=Catenaria anguillulae PL171 TaxID=765915 RepID=A0A1Y2HYH5_9FUNG|nr:hypothetical protein BCR44DRAFT_1252129 [Catenaria anguillulae PL171]